MAASATNTVSQRTDSSSNGHLSLDNLAFPKTLPNSILNSFEKLSSAQAGHLRHFHNLATQADGEWRHMGTQDPGQEWLDAYRYQLAFMAYAAGLAHYHRLPALRSIFKTLIEQLIHKMFRREVWGYWYLTSQSGVFVDPDIRELRRPWADPVVEENIMYSGHLLLMVALHAMLFNDDKYDEPDALTFDWNPLLWGMGPERFSYDRTSLKKVVLEEMGRRDWLGACCEPNNIFVVCNQFPIIALRYIDVRNGTTLVYEVLKKYVTAWEAKTGFTQGGELIINWYYVKQGRTVSDGSIGPTACTGAFMNAWNSEFVQSMYPSQSLGFLHHCPDGRVGLNTPKLAHAIKSLVKERNMDPDTPETRKEAQRMVAQQGGSDTPHPFPPQPDYGYVAQWLSEVADAETLAGFLRHADQFLNPTWERGGLFYPRNDQKQDDEGNWIGVDPFTGNAAIGYARLNVRNGQKIMWDNPWTADHFLDYPFIDSVDLGSDVDFLRGSWSNEFGVMVLTCRTWNGTETSICPRFYNLPSGIYGVYLNGHLANISPVRSSQDVVEVPLLVGGTEVDVVLVRENRYLVEKMEELSAY